MKKATTKEIMKILEDDSMDIMEKLELYAEMRGVDIYTILECAIRLQNYMLLKKENENSYYKKYYELHTIRIK